MAEPAGSCAFRDTCGKKSLFGKELPCPYDGPPVEPNDTFRKLLVDACGLEFASGPTCCTSDQVDALRENLQQVEPIISSCPACRNNFRSFFCHFTCSPAQGSFVNVTSTQQTTEGKTAIKSVDFFAGETFSTGFYDSCKDVKFGPSASFAMEFIGGGAKDYHALFKFLGEEKALGSPFQIDFPSEVPQGYLPLDPPPRNCADADLGSKCVCVDCPSICPALPGQPTPAERAASCQVGAITCLSFVLLVAYGLAATAFLFGFTLQRILRRKKDRSYERVALSGDTSSSLNNQGVVSQPLNAPGSGSNAGNRSTLVGASSLALYFDGEESAAPSENARHHLGRGASLLEPIETVQPRQYRLNTLLRRFFYRSGLLCASHPWLVFAIVFAIFAGLNAGWKFFRVETDPVRLWVAPTSESRVQKDFFDEHFGPFYRPQQIFIAAPTNGYSLTEPVVNATVPEELEAVLSWERLVWWDAVEKQIAKLETEDGVHA